jgi:hypothetical protein
VLYLGNDGVLWDKAGSLAQQPRARSQPNRPGGRSGEPADVKTVLARVVQRDTRLDDSQKEDLIGWVIGLQLGDQPVTAAMTWIRLKVKDTVDLRVRDALRSMIGELLGQEQAS